MCYYLYSSCLRVVQLDVRFQTNVLRQPHRFIFCLFRQILYVVNKHFLMKELITVKYANREEKNISSCRGISLLRSFKVQHCADNLSAFWF